MGLGEEALWVKIFWDGGAIDHFGEVSGERFIAEGRSEDVCARRAGVEQGGEVLTHRILLMDARWRGCKGPSG